jgi:hypothetical protein
MWPSETFLPKICTHLTHENRGREHTAQSVEKKKNGTAKHERKKQRKKKKYNDYCLFSVMSSGFASKFLQTT